MNPINKALNKAQLMEGIKNKMAGIVIRTDPRITAKGNRTCQICLTAKATGAPLPPEHQNCRCWIEKV